MAETVGVAEAKKRFSELVDRVERGERFVILRRGRPAMALVPPDEVGAGPERPAAGLVSIVGAIADWPELENVVAEIYASRREPGDRPALSAEQHTE